MENNMLVKIFLLVVGNALALILGLLAFQTTASNLLGWFLLAVSIAYIAGGAIYLWLHSDDDDLIRSERGNRSFWLILPGFIAIFFVPVLDYLYLPILLARGSGMQIAGLVLVALGLSLRIWTRLTLRGLYSGYLRVKVGHVLVTDGPYQIVRHPGYTGFLLMAIGLAIGYSSLIGLAVIPLLLLPGLAYRMRIEEGLLIEEFGDEYSVYTQKVKRLIPGIW